MEKIVTVAVEKQVTPQPAAPSEKEALRAKTLVLNHRGGAIEMQGWYNPYINSRNMQGSYQFMMEPLFLMNYEAVGDSLKPWLATEYKFDADYAGVTIKLNPKAHWSDGEPFTADDVVFTVEILVANPTFRGGNIGKWVQEAKAVDANTVYFKLVSPYPRFVHEQIANTTCQPSIIVAPKHIWEGKDPKTYDNFNLAKGIPVHTGPYKVSQVNKTEVIYEVDPNWWAAEAGLTKLPQVERVVVVGVTAPEEKAAKLQLNEVDVEPNLPITTFETVSKNNPKVISWTDTVPYAWTDPCPLYGAINTQRAPWDDKEMRWALIYAVDKQGFTDIYWEGKGQVARSFFPAYPTFENFLDKHADLFTEYPILSYDPAKAKQIIEGKGYTLNKEGYFEKDGKVLELSVLGGTQTSMQAMEQFLKPVGIKLVPNMVPNSVLQTEALTGNYDLIIKEMCGTAYDPFGALNLFTSQYAAKPGEKSTGPHNNLSRFTNAEYDAAVAEIGKLPPGDPGVEALWVKAQSILMDEVPILTLSQQTTLGAFNTTYWTGFPTKKDNYIQPQSWCAPFLDVVWRLQPAQ